jgi:hypothetical protein
MPTSFGRYLFALGLLGALAERSRSNPQPFHLNSTESTYPVVTEVLGGWERHGDSLLIEVYNGRVINQLRPDLGSDGEVAAVSLRFGLGRQEKDGWDMSPESDSQEVARSLTPGHTASLLPSHFVIVGVDTVPLADRWLVVQVGVSHHLPGIRAGRLHSYACATDNLEGPTSASEHRANDMRKHYSKTC